MALAFGFRDAEAPERTPRPKSRFGVSASKQTVFDRERKLTWQKAPAPERMTLAEARGWMESSR